MRIIDAHQHYWRVQRADYGWLKPELGALYRDFEPADFDAACDGRGIVGTVLVQAAATEAETQFLLQLALAHPSVAGVVGWVDFEAADVARRLAALIGQGAGLLRGLRPMVQDMPDDRWLTRPAIDPAFDSLIACNLTFDALVRPIHLPALIRRLERHPDLRIVLDHCGKPDIARAGFRDWAAQISQLAESTCACCKLSGLLTEAPPDASAADLGRYVEHVIACFGTDRILWGSDWPVLTLRASYDRWLDMALGLVRRYAPGREQAIFSDNAIRFYGLEPRERSWPS